MHTVLKVLFQKEEVKIIDSKFVEVTTFKLWNGIGSHILER